MNPKTNTSSPAAAGDKGKELTRKVLAKVERYLDKNTGSVKRLSEFLSKRLGKNVARQRVTRWFAGDHESRPEPLLSTGMLMLEWLKLEEKRAKRDRDRTDAKADAKAKAESEQPAANQA